ncbi:MAG: flagellar basal body protein FliL, partial [Treponema sp.]|nr:flagellar basal body protein FliL [Treponema sp.]
IFTGIGRIRASTGAPEPATVILSIAFPYPSQDRAFSEELAARIGDFRSGAIAYFASLSTEELRQKDEAAIKTELLGRFNDLLRLGRITALYFSDYLIIE